MILKCSNILDHVTTICRNVSARDLQKRPLGFRRSRKKWRERSYREKRRRREESRRQRNEDCKIFELPL